MTRTACRLVALSALLLALVFASPALHAETRLGTLTCKRIAGSGVNFIVTSSAAVRCRFEGSHGTRQWYVGETGVKFGLELKFSGEETLVFAILSQTTEHAPEGDFLSGAYRGATADAALGFGLGASILVGGNDNTFALKPALETATGAAGISAGLGYLDLRPDPLMVARMTTPHGEPFAQALYAGYFDHAYERYHASAPAYADADYFSGRAISTAETRAPEPEKVSHWPLPAVVQADAASARERVVEAIIRSGGATTRAAQAQVAFDCWLHALTSADSARERQCRDALEQHLAAVEAAVRTIDLRARVMRSMWSRVVFPADGNAINDAGRAVIARVVKRLGYLTDARLHVSGHSDQPGSKAYNLELSKQRAAAVRQALLAAGVADAWITSDAYGEEYPIHNNPHDALNRRVDIVLTPLAVDEARIAAAIAEDQGEPDAP